MRILRELGRTDAIHGLAVVCFCSAPVQFHGMRFSASGSPVEKTTVTPVTFSEKPICSGVEVGHSVFVPSSFPAAHLQLPKCFFTFYIVTVRHRNSSQVCLFIIHPLRAFRRAGR